MDYAQKLARQFSLRPEHANNIIELIDGGNTLPFIARYRKEMTGAIDDQLLHEVADRLQYLRNFDKRADDIRTAVEDQGKMTPEITAALAAAATLSELEDIYRPFKKKRTTRGSQARERGLEPLADRLWSADKDFDLTVEAEGYVDADKGVPDAEAAIAGARDILAENLSDDAELRKKLRAYLQAEGVIESAAKTKESTVYDPYYSYQEPAAKIPAHRILAVNRGESEGVLKVSVAAPRECALRIIAGHVGLDHRPMRADIAPACEDSYDRLIFPSLERELRSDLTERASESAIQNFSLNLRQLLMQPPIKGAVTLGFDPAFRTGCKLAVVDAASRVLDTAVIYPTPPQSKAEEAAKKLAQLIDKYHITVVAIGNGTASRESEAFVASVLKAYNGKVGYVIVSESGASVYSASKLAAEEFPQYDVSLRSAVSIARRLQDPLAELVKIDPKAIGVGQYQHDMPSAQLSAALSGVVEGCVNAVGVDLNTASQSLLSYVAGVGDALARGIVLYREENGPFESRKQLSKVPKLGPKAFEQCAGFLRIPEGTHFLDNTSVHPESYGAALKLCDRCRIKAADVRAGKLGAIDDEIERVGLGALAAELGIGEPTLRDIVQELHKPGRDPRDELPAPVLRTDVLSLSDLREGMELRGTVRNVVDFGAFVDIGVHEDGLVHISQIADRYIKHPSDALSVGDVVKVRVLTIDLQKKRIGLTMKGVPQK